MKETEKLQTRCGVLEYAVGGEGWPCIVLFNGAGMTLEGWRAVMPGILALGTVVAWNRFGVEGSDAPDRAQGGAVVVASVRELLRYVGAEPPFVLVGHSLGALHAGLFARLHPEDVAGLLMIEPANPDRVRELDPGHLERSLTKVQQVPADAFRENLRAEVDAVDLLAKEIECAGELPDVPVDVLAGGGGHFPQITEPQAVLDAIALLVTRARRACAAPLSLLP